MGKPSTIESFYKRTNDKISESTKQSSSSIDVDSLNVDNRPTKSQKVKMKEGFHINSLQRDPRLRPQICEYPINQRDEIRCNTLNLC